MADLADLKHTMIALQLTTLFVLLCSFSLAHGGEADRPIALRIATFNVEDVRSEDLAGVDNPRLKEIAAILQRIRPNILLLNEIAVSQEAGPTNAEKFAYNYLGVSQGEGLAPLRYRTYTPPTNTGIPTWLDLDRSGTKVLDAPKDEGGRQTKAQIEYGNDCFGFGTFPGQYGMALFVDTRLEIQTDAIRTFQKFLWRDLPGHTAPVDPESGEPWYDDEAWSIFRLPSKNFADVPIRLPNGTVLHALISHPTPPGFDGPEKRNVLRNHDEIRLIRAYIDNEPALYDDNGRAGGLDGDDPFVILGDLNADPTGGSSVEMTMFSVLFSSARVAHDAFPSSDVEIEGLDKTDTARFKLRVDYVLPSEGVEITDSGVWRRGAEEGEFPSDHFPVWIEATVP